MYDLAIIGAGPAGAMLARLIGKQYRVLLVDEDRWMGRRSFGWASAAAGCWRPMRRGCCRGWAWDCRRACWRTRNCSWSGPSTSRGDSNGTTSVITSTWTGCNSTAGYCPWCRPASDVRLGCRLHTYELAGRRISPDARPGRQGVYGDGENRRRSGWGGVAGARADLGSSSPAPKKYFAIQEWVEADREHALLLFDLRSRDHRLLLLDDPQRQPPGHRGGTGPPRQDQREDSNCSRRRLGRLGHRVRQDRPAGRHIPPETRAVRQVCHRHQGSRLCSARPPAGSARAPPRGSATPFAAPRSLRRSCARASRISSGATTERPCPCGGTSSSRASSPASSSARP